MSISSSIEFPLSPLRGSAGVVAEPIIPVGIETCDGFKLYDFLIDSGADFSLLPRSLAEEIGVSLKQCKKSVTQGVEGKGMRIYQTRIRIRLGRWEDIIRCAFADHDYIPPLLGRLDLFSKYNITFHARRRSVIFQRAIPSPPGKKVDFAQKLKPVNLWGIASAKGAKYSDFRSIRRW